ncbi:SWIM zinc finger family protein [Kineococcus sp. SYSU DK006]|uniref:SWIM zinc finger family protein n=1 Tax=Kineococcus sp. SYSU DK006 TaxID=3383127 RepID=UPI003D7CAAA6
MIDRWSAEQVLALAPDAAGAAAGRKLAVPAPWSQTGALAAADGAGGAVWGLCRGSGSTPYQTVVDLSGPAFRCSCPSRKFPCKHAVGLLLLWSGGAVPEAAAPAPHAEAWLAGRADRAARTTPAAPRPAATADPAAAARRAGQRATRVADGVEELSRWLRDQARTGLAGADHAGYARTDPVAARLVDAQATALASAVRRLAGVAVSGPGWSSRLLEEHALLHLLTAAHGRLATLPAPLADTVRSRVGAPPRTADVLAGPGVRDRWSVVSLRDRVEDRLVARRAHLAGERTGRTALVLSFAPPGQPLDASLVPGTAVEADLHFHPGAHPLRAVVGARHGDPGPPGAVAAEPVAAAHARWAAAVAADPWLTELPVVLADVVPSAPVDASERAALRGAGPAGRGWALVDPAGHAIPLADPAGVWTLLAVGGARPCAVAGDWTPDGVRLSAALTADGPVAL